MIRAVHLACGASVGIKAFLVGVLLLARCADGVGDEHRIAALLLTFFCEVEHAKPVQSINKELRARLSSTHSLRSGPWVFEATNVVMINHLDSTVVPDAALKSLPSKRRRSIAGVLQA